MKTQLFFILALFSIFAFSSCRSTQKLTETGNYDRAIRQSVNRLAGKKNKKAKEVWALEDAFFKANARDMERISQLRREGRSENWAAIYDVARKVDKRQDLVRPLIPLRDDRGREAKFKFVKINSTIQEARTKAAAHLYELGMRELALARQGSKQAAREAYEHFDDIKRYEARYKDREVRMEEALALGTQYILFKVKQDGRTVMPRDFEQALLAIDMRELNDKWKVYDAQPQRGITYDYEIVLMLQDLDVSPERVRERTYIEEHEIEEGKKMLLDENNNVVKDTSGNIVYVPNIRLAVAEILEMEQTKAATVTGKVMLYDRRRRRLLDSDEVTADALFEHVAATFRGDREALSSESKRLMGSNPVDFPPDDLLLLEAAESLKPIVLRKIRRLELPL